MRAGAQATWWARFRAWLWWWQVLLWALLAPLPTTWWALSRPKGQRRGPAALAVAGTLAWATAAASGNGGTTDPEPAATARGKVRPPASTPPTSSGPSTPGTPSSTTTTAATSAAPPATATTGPPIATTTTTTTTAGIPAEDRDPTAILAGLRVAPEGPRAGYSRDLFPHWVDADGDRCDTREEVLIAESTSPAQVDPYGCKVVAGDWVSLYDGLTTGDPAELDVDHVVALAEAWDSGASSWDEARRRDFANDLDHPQALRAVSASSNRSKSDSDPAQWRPPRPEAWCEFARDWVAVKFAWDLAADEAEVAVLRQLLGTCGGGTAPPTTATTATPPWPTTSTTAPPPAPGGTALGFTAMQCDAPGSPDDAGNANEEWVTVTNTGAAADLSGWTIADEAGNTYAFSSGFTLGPGASMTLHTGTGADTGRDLYWGRAQHVWNNGGDTAFLKNAGGGVVASRSC